MRDADRRAEELVRATALEIGRLRSDAGMTLADLARITGLDPSYVGRIEAADRDPSTQALCRLAAALGADPVRHLYPNTGAPVRDRWQARIMEALLETLHPRWIAFPEVPVRRPVRGVIDLVLHERGPNRLVAVEVESGLRRLEQQIRWANEKAEALESTDLFGMASAVGRPTVSRLLVVRSTRPNHEIAQTFARTLGAAYPGSARDVHAAITSDVAWPGAGILWARVDGRTATILKGEPRGRLC
jgi:transcriptional regulator with XRE-family HTH domain